MPPSARAVIVVASTELDAPKVRANGVRRNRLGRLGFFFVGLILFYAPFALVARAAGAIFPGTMPATWVSDVHTACMRMPIGWLVQPWMWGALDSNPLYYVPIVILPLAAVAGAPLFCGWLCPAGAFPEFLGRLVPDRFKWDPKGSVEITSVRYGFLAGFLIVPFIASSVCCSFCNFTWIQNIVSALTGNVSSWLYVATTGVVTIVLWIFVLGIFTKGGRGWCLFLCPSGALMSLVAGATSKIKWLARVRHDPSSCTGCATCAEVCPVRAIEVTAASPADTDEPDGPARTDDVKVNQYLCNACLDCVRGCPTKSLRYGATK